jgi:hypothetical protein
MTDNSLELAAIDFSAHQGVESVPRAMPYETTLSSHRFDNSNSPQRLVEGVLQNVLVYG